MALASLFEALFRNEIISFSGSYHGSTIAAINTLGNEEYKRSFRPLIPSFKQLEFNNTSQLNQITRDTACVILEPIQTASGMITPDSNFLVKLKERCTETETLLIFDEIQTALGRTGKMV